MAHDVPLYVRAGRAVSWLLWIAVVCVLALGIQGIQTTIAAWRSELQQSRRSQRQAKSRRHERRPALLAIVLANNDALMVTRCLDSLRRARYPNLQVVVVDTGSTDGTRRVAQRYQQDHPSLKLSVRWSRSLLTQRQLIKKGMGTHTDAQSVLILQPNQTINATALRAVADHSKDGGWQLLTPNLNPVSELTFGSLLQRYRQLLTLRRTQAEQTIELTKRTELSLPIICRPSAITGVNLQKLRRRYADNIHISLAGGDSDWHELTREAQRWLVDVINGVRKLAVQVKSDSSWQSLTGLVLATYDLLASVGRLLLPVLFTLTIYLALSLNQPALLIAASGVYCALILLAISDSGLPLKQRIAAISLLPAALPILFISSVIWPIVIIQRTVKLILHSAHSFIPA
jgi:hypothetical protein